jgi:hypothetical protein
VRMSTVWPTNLSQFKPLGEGVYCGIILPIVVDFSLRWCYTV